MATFLLLFSFLKVNEESIGDDLEAPEILLFVLRMICLSKVKESRLFRGVSVPGQLPLL